MKHWWKILAVLLLLYVLLAGLLIPLGPGIKNAEGSLSLRSENSSLSIQGYNTRFDKNDPSLKVWLENEGKTVCASRVDVQSPSRLTATFDLPSSYPIGYSNIFINSDKDGTFGLESGVGISASSGETTADTLSSSSQAACNVAVKNEKADFTNYPHREILYETIRNLFFHVPMWFAMLIVFTISLVYSIKYLRSSRIEDDTVACEMANSGILLGILGVATGSMWAKHTWGAWWVNDPQLNGAAIAILVYLAYIILRGSMDEEQKRGRIAAVYSIFAYVMLIVFVGIYPKMSNSSLHPNTGDNASFRDYDMDNTMRMVFYPAVIGFALLAIWIASIKIRLRKIYRKVLFNV